jgi:teichuronic acid exporter
MSLMHKSLKAVFWSGTDVFLRQGIQLITSILLARLLLPEDFGVLAMLYLLTGIAGLFIDSGFNSALVKSQDITITDESTVFFFNLGSGMIVALGLCVIAPWLAAFFEQPILQSLTYVMALNLFLGAFGSIQSTMLIKALNFKLLMKIGIFSTIMSSILAVGLAWKGFGVWSLAFQSLISTVSSVVLLWLWGPWRPRATFNFASLRSFFSFGGFLLFSGLLDTLYTRLYTLIIGKLFSARDLGLYARAAGTQEMPVNVLTGMISRVAFPLFSSVSSNRDQLQRGMRKALVGMMMLNVPAMLGLLSVAEPLVITFFGAKWLPCVPVLRILCLAGVLWPLHTINLNVLIAQGHSKLFFRIEVLKKVIGVAAILAACPFGVEAIAWSQVMVGIFCFFINAHYTGVQLGYGALAQVRDFMPSVLAAAPMAALMMTARWLLNLESYAMLPVQIVLGASLYLGIAMLINPAEMREMLIMVRRSTGATPVTS